jgi:hypothetical protein
MAYGDLINFDGREVQKEPNPCVRTFGKGPEGAKCKSCQHFFAKQFARTYYKCDIRGNTGGPGTDHRANWKACSKYQYRLNNQERNTR